MTNVSLVEQGSGSCVCTKDSSGNLIPGTRCVVWWGVYDNNTIVYDYCDGTNGSQPTVVG